MPTYFEKLSNQQLAESIENPDWKALEKFFINAGGTKRKTISNHIISRNLHWEASKRFVLIIMNR